MVQFLVWRLVTLIEVIRGFCDLPQSVQAKSGTVS